MDNLTKLTFVTFLLFFIGLNFVNAEDSIFQKDTLFTLEIGISNADFSPCDLCICNISIFYPNGSAFVKNADAVNSGDGFCRFSNITSIIGVYSGDLYVTDGVDYGRSTFQFEVTVNGDKPDITSGIIYFAILIISMILLILLIYYSVTTNKKYLKIGLLGLAYLSIIWVLFVLWQLAFNYLAMEGLASVLRIFFLISVWAIFPLGLLLIIITIKEIYDDITEKKMFERGIFQNE